MERLARIFYIFVAIAVYNEVERRKKKVNDDFYQYNTESVCNGLLTFQKRKMSLFLREFNYLKG